MWDTWIGWLMTCKEFDIELACGGGEPPYEVWISVQPTRRIRRYVARAQ